MTKKTSMQREHLTADAIEKKLLASESPPKYFDPRASCTSIRYAIESKKD